MTTDFTHWLKANFLDKDVLEASPAAGRYGPECEGKQKCFERLLDVIGMDVSPENELKFKANIHVCKPCYDEFDVQLAIRKAMQHKVKEEAVPSGLLDQIRSKMDVTA